MAIIAIFQSPTLTQARYEESVRQLTKGKARMHSAADWPVPGLIAHIAGQSPSGFRVVDVWDSEASFRAFGAHLMPILKTAGVEGEPEIYPAHTVVKD